MRPRESVFAEVFRGIGGRRRIAFLIGAYFDESAESDSENGLLAVCGYALDTEGVGGLIPEWQTMLDKFDLPYFHMNECNADERLPGKNVFAHLSNRECDQCAREAIRIARAYPLHGHAFALDQREYRGILQDQGFDIDPYTFMVWGAFIHVNRWVHMNRPDEKISLFFEKGYKRKAARRANELLDAVLHDPWSGKNHVVSHTFVKKEDSEPTQAADLIAWQVRKGFENWYKNKPIRKDTMALIENRKTLTIEFTATRLRSLRDDFIKTSGSLAMAAKTIFSENGLPPEAGR